MPETEWIGREIVERVKQAGQHVRGELIPCLGAWCGCVRLNLVGKTGPARRGVALNALFPPAILLSYGLVHGYDKAVWENRALQIGREGLYLQAAISRSMRGEVFDRTLFSPSPLAL
jgi:hypothetical protein